MSTPDPLAKWLDENSFGLTDYGDGSYKLSCMLCGPILRDASLDAVTGYAEEHPTNPCLDFLEWETTS
jgi:hypothetical protein